MALEAVVFSQDPLITTYNCCTTSSSNNNSNNNNVNNFGGMNHELYFSNYYSLRLEDTSSLKLPYNVGLFEVNNDANNIIYDYLSNNNITCTPELILQNNDVPQWNHHQQQQQQQQQYVPPSYSSPEENHHRYLSSEGPPPTTPATPVENGGGSHRKRRRRSCKNKEEVEHQRMTHIAVERNRRKQMNEYLAVIRSIMPPSYVQRGDQASIVGGAINYVKELEQLLQSIEAQKPSYNHNNNHDQPQQPSSPEGGSCDDKNVDSQEPQLPFADFFSFPQYSTRSKLSSPARSGSGSGLGNINPSVSSSNTGVADIEVTMVESHANVKILAKKQPKQLVKLIAGFQGLRLNVLHLNVTTVDSFVLYSVSLKVEDGCQLNSVDDIAAASNHILGQIQEEAADHLL